MTVRVPMLNTDTDSAETFRLAMGGLWVPASALNVRTGVTSTPVLTGTGNLTATVGAFNGVIDGTSGALQGSYPVALDTATTITIGAGNTQARIDLICLQVKDNDYDASGLHQGVPVVVAGTPSGSPVAPAAPANSISLWTLPVPALATTVNFATATAVFPYTAAAGGIVPVRNSSDKPAAPNGVQYRHRLDVTAAAGSTSPLEASVDGVNWYPVYDASAVPAVVSSAITAAVTPSWVAVPSSGTWTTTNLTCSKVGNTVTLRGNATAPSATYTASTFSNFATLPAGYRPSADRYMPVQIFFPSTWVTGMLLVAANSGTVSFAPDTTVTNTMSLYVDGVNFSL